MKNSLRLFCVGMLGLACASTVAVAQTAGSARIDATILDYNGSSASHYAVVWVTRQDGTFIKSLRKQGPSWTSGEWNSHCRVWNTNRAGSQVLDGYSSATATSYSGTNNPIIWAWNCRDANNNLMPDGTYKFWVQYAENSGQGPHTTNGLSWIKGPAGVTNSYPNMGANFANLRVTWTPSAPPTVAPTITSAPPTGTGTVGVPYQYSCAATGTAPITFSASSLPTGLSISTAGMISGTPTAAGTFSGTITAANGTAPNATQPFSIVISVVPATIALVEVKGPDLVLSGTGPANGTCALLISDDPSQAMAQWTAVRTNSIDANGHFSVTNGIDLGVPRRFYRLRVP